MCGSLLRYSLTKVGVLCMYSAWFMLHCANPLCNTGGGGERNGIAMHDSDHNVDGGGLGGSKQPAHVLIPLLAS